MAIVPLDPRGLATTPRRDLEESAGWVEAGTVAQYALKPSGSTKFEGSS
jgi:hypothetical protein